MDHLHSFFKRAQSAFKNALAPFVSKATENKPADKKKPVGIIDVFFVEKKRLKIKNAVKKEAVDFSISAIEKSAFIAFQRDYAAPEKSVFSAEAAPHFKQPEKIRISVRSELCPLPVGTVKMLDLCKNSIQSF